MTLHILAFWLVVGAVAVSITWARFLERLAFERTMRQAIDKGVIGDTDILSLLRPPPPPSWGARLAALGLAMAGTGVGVVVLGLALGLEKAKSLPTFGGLGALVLCAAAGLVVAGLWLRRAERDSPDLVG